MRFSLTFAIGRLDESFSKSKGMANGSKKGDAENASCKFRTRLDKFMENGKKLRKKYLHMNLNSQIREIKRAVGIRKILGPDS